MDKVKIQEIAYEAGLSNDELIEKAKELGFNVTAPNSKVSIDDAGILVDYAISDTLPKGFKKPARKSGIRVSTKKESPSSKVPSMFKGLDKIIDEVEELYEKDLNIKYWLIPSNPTEFDVVEELKKGKVWWSNKLNAMKPDDIVYIYISKPVQRISIKCKILEIDEDKKVFCIELIDFLDSDKLTYEELLKQGLTNIQGKREIKNVLLLKYIQENENLIKNEYSSLDGKQIFSIKSIEYDFAYKNILLKGVPGTGKSRTVENIISNNLNLKEHHDTNVLRINVHSASSNADLMQGIGISSNDDGHIEYKEKQGLILELIERATFNPNQPFALVLEEIQENSLNELIGDLIYLIEDSKRAKGYEADNKEYTYSELLDEIRNQNSDISYIELPSLISKQEKTKQMIIPNNLYIFCTSNYRDDRKVIEDNLLRRFEVIEIYPLYQDDEKKRYKDNDVAKFLNELNTSIMKVCQESGEIHPDRFMIGHSIWLNVKSKKEFNRAFLKVITEFKDIKDTHFDEFEKITKDLKYPFEIEVNYNSYEEWIKALQTECYDFLS